MASLQKRDHGAQGGLRAPTPLRPDGRETSSMDEGVGGESQCLPYCCAANADGQAPLKRPSLQGFERMEVQIWASAPRRAKGSQEALLLLSRISVHRRIRKRGLLSGLGIPAYRKCRANIRSKEFQTPKSHG